MGGLAFTSISAQSTDFTQITVQVSGLPAGVTVLPSTVTLTPETPQQLTFSASESATVSNATVTFTGTRGSETQSTNLTLTIASQPTNSYTMPWRMRYVRTDAATQYFAWLNSSWIIYNAPTSRFFVTDPYSNRIFVLDATTEAVVGTIGVPGAFGIDDTADHTTLYVGTQIGNVYAIDPVSMTVTKRYLAAQIGPNGFNAYSVRVMADGRLALLGGQGGIPSVDGYGEFAIWSPADNSITIYATPYTDNFSNTETIVCGPSVGKIGGFTRTPDRTKVVMVGMDSGGALCEVDEATGANNYATFGTWSAMNLAISPNGNWIVLPNAGQAIVIDAQTLAQVAAFNIAGDTSTADEFAISPDSKTAWPRLTLAGIAATAARSPFDVGADELPASRSLESRRLRHIRARCPT